MSPGGGPTPPRRTGRRPGAADTRGRILDAARTAFSERGFEGTSVRLVATGAGVDAALVHHYFGTKQRLFVAAMEFPVDFASTVPALLDGPPDRLGERFIRFILELWDQPRVRPMLLGVVRSAATDLLAATMLRDVLAAGPILALVTALDRPDAPLRASLAGSQFLGLVLARYVVGIEPLASLDADDVARVMGPTIQRYLTGDLGAGATAGATPPAGR